MKYKKIRYSVWYKTIIVDEYDTDFDNKNINNAMFYKRIIYENNEIRQYWYTKEQCFKSIELIRDCIYCSQFFKKRYYYDKNGDVK